MKKLIFLILLYSLTSHGQTVNVTGGVSKGSINSDILKAVIQKKQQEVFSRLFQNIIVKYFTEDGSNNPVNDLSDGIYNFPTYYTLYNLMNSLTIGKSKTTVSVSSMNAISELAVVYAYVKYYQNYQVTSANLSAVSLSSANDQRIENLVTVNKKEKDDDQIGKVDDKIDKDVKSIEQINCYMEAAYYALSTDKDFQNEFAFTETINSPEIKIMYDAIGLNNSKYNSIIFHDVLGNDMTLTKLIYDMQKQIKTFINFSKTAKVTDDNIIKLISSLKKNKIQFKGITKDQVDAIALCLNEYASKCDFLFDKNIIKEILDLTTENIHFKTDDGGVITEAYIDVESLLLSLDKEFINKNSNSSISSRCFFINPRPFFTIGIDNVVFPNSNKLDKSNGTATSLSNVTIASEKIGFRVKLWDGGYTSSFGPGQVYKWHGKNCVWNQPQQRPLVSSVYYSVYASGLLYNAVNLKTNQNFNYGFAGTNVGVIFFNGLELSTGVGWIYQNGLSSHNSFIKLDFDIPIIDYISALTAKNN